MTPLQSLCTAWRERAELFRRHGAEPQARTCEELAKELEQQLIAAENEALTPAEAEAAGLCDAETLRRAVRKGRAQNVGTAGKIRVPRNQIPKGRGGAGGGTPSFVDIGHEALLSRRTRRK